MKLAFVSDFYYPSIGGTQMLCKSVAEWFKKHNNEIEVITSYDPKRQEMDYTVNQLQSSWFANSNILLEKNYDAVFVFADLLSPSLLTIKPGEIKRSILVLNLDENVYRWIKEGMIKDIAQRVKVIKNFDHVVSFCQGAPVNKFLDDNKVEYCFIPNFSRDILTGPKSDKITKESLGINKKIIFNHGRLHPNKNIHKMIEAYADSDLKDEYDLVILGAISDSECTRYLNKCNKVIKDKKVSNSVKILKGTTNQVIVNSLLSISDVYFLPSPSEGLPLVLIEAMSAGLPWVSTPVGGIPAVFGKHDNGVLLETTEFSPKEVEDAITKIKNKNSRQDWENNYDISKVAEKYATLLNTDKKYHKELQFLKKYKISFGNQVYNEPEGIKNYLNSCLQFAGVIEEVYIINHRSSDDTLEVIESFENKYKEAGIKLRWKTEPRDFSKDFTIADLFGAAVNECENEIVFRHDADFVFGKGYVKTMYEAIKRLEQDDVYACGYEIPVVSNSIKFKEKEIIDYGFCNMHVSVPRIFKKSKTKCLQNHVGGKYEWFYPTDKSCSRWVTIPHFRQSLISVNVKSQERQELRETMNTFMEDIKQGKIDGNWLDNNNLRREKEEWANEHTDMKKINIIGEKYEF